MSTEIFVRREEEVLLIDSIDEVHPDTAKRFIDAIEKDVQEATAKARRRCAFVFGRAEGFGDYFSRSNDERRRVLYLRSPEWRSVGDLHNLYKSFVSYTKKAYSDEVFQRLVHLTRELPYVLDSMKSLSLAIFLMERAYSSPRVEDGDIRGAMYRTILDRSSRTHGRPTLGSLHGRIYQGLLRAVADKYAHRVEISPTDSELGYFEVKSTDVVHLKTGESASVWTVLDRSGFAESRPIDRTMRKYRFAPLWCQRYLLEEVD